MDDNPAPMPMPETSNGWYPIKSLIVDKFNCSKKPVPFLFWLDDGVRQWAELIRLVPESVDDTGSLLISSDGMPEVKILAWMLVPDGPVLEQLAKIEERARAEGWDWPGLKAPPQGA
jgi:hypothetical protein